MNGSKGYRASGADEKPAEIMFSLEIVHRMLPLVQRIVDDAMAQHHTLERIRPEALQLERRRRNLPWPQRQRRYQLQEEANLAHRQLDSAREELQGLGVVLLDDFQGRVGFPTLVNNRAAFFSWQPGEDGIHNWHFAEDENLRPIPQAWMRELAVS